MNLPAATALATMMILSGLSIVTRHWPTRSRGMHRAQPRLVTLDELLGEPSAYTSYDSLTDVPQPGPIRQGFGWCEPCANTMPGTINRDGFLCGGCFTPAGGGY